MDIKWDDTISLEERERAIDKLLTELEKLGHKASGIALKETIYAVGWGSFLAGRFSDAIEHFDNFLRRYPYSVSANGARNFKDMAGEIQSGKKEAKDFPSFWFGAMYPRVRRTS